MAPARADDDAREHRRKCELTRERPRGRWRVKPEAVVDAHARAGFRPRAWEMLLANARLPLWLVRAENTAFEQRSSLKARGYRWDDGGGKRVKAWWIMTNDPQSEVEWLRSDIYGDEGDVRVLKIPATKRYSSRVWEE